MRSFSDLPPDVHRHSGERPPHRAVRRTRFDRRCRGRHRSYLTALIAPYLAARERGAVGTVVGRAYAEAARPGDSPRPYAAVSVLLLPRPLDSERPLDAIRAG